VKIRNRIRRSDWDRFADRHRPAQDQRTGSTPAGVRGRAWLALALLAAALTLAGAVLFSG
jgi:hypothetical protein